MSWGRWLAGGLIATVVFTVVLAFFRGLRLTRLSLPLLLGTMITADRDRAERLGLGIHALCGWLLALGYGALFHALLRSGLWLGALFGLVHGGLVLTVVLPGFPAWHPRMASAEMDSTVIRQLEPPGFLGVFYGPHTPDAVMLAHVLYGAVLGLVFRL